VKHLATEANQPITLAAPHTPDLPSW